MPLADDHLLYVADPLFTLPLLVAALLLLRVKTGHPLRKLVAALGLLRADTALAGQLTRAFHQDVQDDERIEPQRWKGRSRLRQLGEKAARLVSPLL